MVPGPFLFSFLYALIVYFDIVAKADRKVKTIYFHHCWVDSRRGNDYNYEVNAKKKDFMMKKTLWITQTAVLTALLVLLQSVTKAGGQFLTGSCVNAVLGVAVLYSGLWSGVTVAVISPFLAYALGIGPQIVPVIPAIAVGNAVYVLVLYFLCFHEKFAGWRQWIGWICAALCKFLALYFLVAQLLCRVLPLAEKQIATLTAMFSWPQLVTALIGGVIALLIVPVLRKSFRR